VPWYDTEPFGSSETVRNGYAVLHSVFLFQGRSGDRRGFLLSVNPITGGSETGQRDKSPFLTLF